MLLVQFGNGTSEMLPELGLEAEAATAQEKDRWRVRARRQRYISYLMAGAIGVIGWLMMSKPSF